MVVCKNSLLNACLPASPLSLSFDFYKSFLVIITLPHSTSFKEYYQSSYDEDIHCGGQNGDCPPEAHGFGHCPRLVVHLGEVTEPSRDGALLAEIHLWRRVLKVYSLTPLSAAPWV